MRRSALCFAAALVPAVIALVAAAPAEAGGTHVFLGFNFYAPAPWYYAPPPVYYVAPPPPVYYPAPVPYYAPPPAYAPAPLCRRYNGDATIDASGQPFYGTACLEADGHWHIVP